MFGLRIVRKRVFEFLGMRAPYALEQQYHRQTTLNGGLACVVGRGANRGRFDGTWAEMPAALKRTLLDRNSAAGWSAAMGIDWMTRNELSQAIPPAYSRFIGEAAISAIRGSTP